MNEFPDWLASTLASDATAGVGILPPWIGPLKPGVRAIGPAFVALMSQDDNLSVREAMHASPQPGSVLVVAGSGVWPSSINGYCCLIQKVEEKYPKTGRFPFYY